MTIFRSKSQFVAILLIICSGCSGPSQLSCDVFSPVQGITSPKEMLVFPDAIVETASGLTRAISADPSLVGFTGSFQKSFAGTKAYSIANELNSLRRMVAYQVALEQANANAGRPLLDIRDEKNCELLADSVASLDQGQSSEQILKNLAQIEAYFGAEYAYREEGMTQ